jgi:hypothetical protein
MAEQAIEPDLNDPSGLVPFRDQLRHAHADRTRHREECDRLRDAHRRARELVEQCAHQMDDMSSARHARLAEAGRRTAEALLSGSEHVQQPVLAHDADDREITERLRIAEAAASAIAGQLQGAQAGLTEAEAAICDAAASLLIELGEKLAGELEAIECAARGKRLALRRLSELWVSDRTGRARAFPVGADAHWALTDGDPSTPEAIIGAKALRARQIGRRLLVETATPDWARIYRNLLEDPETPVDLEA